MTDYTHLAGVTLKLMKIDNLAQGKNIKIKIDDRKFTYHIDGEPITKQGPVDIELKYRGPVKFLKYFDD